MIYRDFHGEKISALGMGTMRLPVINGQNSCIDVEQTSQMVAYAMEHGVNYYDLAWAYHGGNNEPVMGKILSNYQRESFYAATKFPGYDLSNIDKVEEIFESQLKKCGFDYFDFYLFHNVCELNIDAYLDKSHGILAYLLKQKENGRIRHLGFSTHGNLSTMKRFLDAYGKYMEFCQIQLNYLDWTFQNGKEKIELLKQYNLPVWIMEPMRGGKLAVLPEKPQAMLAALRTDRSPAEWSFRFLQSVHGIITILGGMSSLEQMKENLTFFDYESPLTYAEVQTLFDAASLMVGQTTLPCTACRYCADHCPQGLDIPWLIELYNEHCFSNGGFIASFALKALPEDKQPSSCLGCRSCEAVCPQQIKISEAFADFARKIKR